MDLILCHTTADFDTLGAAVGMTLLLPGARIVLTGGAHPTVRDFLALHRDEYPLIELRSVHPETIRSLTVVDTQRRDRLGKASPWLDLPQLQSISLYDHHMGTHCDIPATDQQIHPVGSTTALVAEKLEAAGIQPNPFIATAMALGIHVDTGSLIFGNATPRDARALAWLMEQGANVDALGDYIEPGLSPELQGLLSEAIAHLQSQTIQGQVVSWVMLATEGHARGLAGLATQLLELTASDAILLGAHYPVKNSGEERVSIIGRSRIKGTNLQQLFTPLGGGGHGAAASLALRSAEPKQILDKLRRQLISQVPPSLTARELMSSPVRTIRPETLIDEAQRILLRYGHSGLSVVDDSDQLVGIISRRDLDLALHHGFAHAPVKGYMSTRLKTITPQTPLTDIEQLMVTYDIGRLPVLNGDHLVGVVTRTDVLRQLHRSHLQARGIAQTDVLTNAPTLSTQSVRDLLRSRLIPELWQLLETTANYAEAQGWHLYLVGGGVRDLLLADPDEPLLLNDIDLVVDGYHAALSEAAGVEMAKALQAKYSKARLEIHGKFQTAALLWRNDPTFDSLWVDIATARTEFYPYPAANPVVEASSIRQDLYRRDFTINALAVQLTEPKAGELLDYFGGVLDLRDRQIRVLHNNSFIEDPTRIYRAVRFAVRLGFEIEPQTRDHIAYALDSGVYDRTQGENAVTPALQTRLRSELEYILEAQYWQPALRLLGELEALKCIHNSLRLTPKLWRRIRLVDRALSQINQPSTTASLTPWLLRLEILLAELAPELRGSIATKLQLPTDSIKRLSQLAQQQDAVHEQLNHVEAPSQVYKALSPISIPSLILIAAATPLPQRRQMWCYLTHWIAVKPPINGNDLKQLGYKPGKQFKVILEELRWAVLDGELPKDITEQGAQGGENRGKAAAIAWVKSHHPLTTA